MKTRLDKTNLRAALHEHLGSARRFSMTIALVTRRGIEEIRSELEKFLERSGEGKVLFGTDLATEPAAIKVLMGWAACYPERFQLRHFRSDSGIYHPKLFVFQSRTRLTVIVGSANLTGGGLDENYEAGVALDDQKSCREFDDFADQCFWSDNAHLIDNRWLAAYRRVWKARRPFAQKSMSIGRRVLSIPVPRPAPKRIAGYRFAFTGGIEDWPRHRLYPEVQRLGGHVVENPTAVYSADCLVQGKWNTGIVETQKHSEAIANDLPKLDEREFLAVLSREHRLRSKRRAK